MEYIWVKEESGRTRLWVSTLSGGGIRDRDVAHLARMPLGLLDLALNLGADLVMGPALGKILVVVFLRQRDARQRPRTFFDGRFGLD